MAPIAVTSPNTGCTTSELSHYGAKQMHARIRLLAYVAISVCTVLAAHPAKADTGDKAGWSVAVDPRKRAFLYYVPTANDARLLTIGCLRDVDSFTIFSTGLKPGINSDGAAALRLSSGKAQYAVDGTLETDQAAGTQTFDIDIDADAKGLRKIGALLLPVLESSSPITLSIGAAEFTLPTSEIAQPLSRFKMVCQGIR
jgi:hypothetical protein